MRQSGERGLLAVFVHKDRVDKVGAVVGKGAVVVVHDNLQLLGTGDIYVHLNACFLGCARHQSAVEDGAVEQLAVATLAGKDHEAHGSGAAGLSDAAVVGRADAFELHGTRRQLEVEHSVGIGGEAAGVGCAHHLHAARIGDVAVFAHHVIVRVREGMVEILSGELVFRVVGENHGGVDPVAVVVVEVVAPVVHDKRQNVRAFGDVALNVHLMTLGGVGDRLAAVKCVFGGHPLLVAVGGEEGNPLAAVIGVVALPYVLAGAAGHLAGTHTVAVHAKHLLVGETLTGEVAETGHFTANHQGRVADAPEGHHGVLLVVREVGPATVVLGGIAGIGHRHGNLSDGQHIAICVVAHLMVFGPFGSFGKDGGDVIPIVPQVVHHAPLIGQSVTLVVVLILRLAGRERQDDGAAALVNGVANHLNLVRVEWTGDVVHLDEVHTPLGIEVDDAVVVLLSLVGHAHEGIVFEPGAGRSGAVVDLGPCSLSLGGCGVAAAQERVVGRVLGYSSGHAPHDVDAELETHLMYPVCQRFEANIDIAVHTTGETAGRGQIAAVFVEDISLVAPLVVVAGTQGGMLAIPADIHHDILITVLLEIVAHVFCVLNDLRLCYG